MKYCFVYVLLGLLFINQAPGQAPIDYKLLQEELRILGDIAIGTSPKLTEQEKGRIESLIQQSQKQLEGQSMNVLDFINFFSGIDMQTQFDEHASLELSEEVLMPLLYEAKLFPLPVNVQSDRLIVNCTGDVLPFGSVIYAINDTPIDSVLKNLSQEDGTFSRRRMERQFSIIYAIKNPSSGTFTVTYAEPNALERRQKKQLQGIGANEWVKKMNEASVYPLDRASMDNLVNTRYYPDQKAYYFQLNSFSWDEASEKGLFTRLRGSQKNFRKTFDKLFREINNSGAQNLIIDLRHNSGGNIFIPGLLFSYVAKAPFVQQARIEIPDFSFPHQEYIIEVNGDAVRSEKDIANFKDDYRSEFEQNESGYYWYIIERAEQQPDKNAFRGKVYLLVGGRSISASSYFTALFKGEKRGTIVGEAIGGSHHSITAGTDITYQLPHTGIKATVPLMLINFSDELYQKVPEMYIIPDVELSEETYYNYFLLQQDPELETVFELIGRGE